uniref:Uncharacterized protein n=1 Tax=Timema bartmani TaxID=61472 RepID=A0A7R9F5L7_9NEOP|nr:unnamed protein product [Timema bartmani]
MHQSISGEVRGPKVPPVDKDGAKPPLPRVHSAKKTSSGKPEAPARRNLDKVLKSAKNSPRVTPKVTPLTSPGCEAPPSLPGAQVEPNIIQDVSPPMANDVKMMPPVDTDVKITPPMDSDVKKLTSDQNNLIMEESELPESQQEPEGAEELTTVKEETPSILATETPTPQRTNKVAEVTEQEVDMSGNSKEGSGYVW